METFNKTLKETHDWALNRMHTLSEGNFESQLDGCAIHSEFEEWIGVKEDELDVISMEYLDDI